MRLRSVTSRRLRGVKRCGWSVMGVTLLGPAAGVEGLSAGNGGGMRVRMLGSMAGLLVACAPVAQTPVGPTTAVRTARPAVVPSARPPLLQPTAMSTPTPTPTPMPSATLSASPTPLSAPLVETLVRATVDGPLPYPKALTVAADGTCYVQAGERIVTVTPSGTASPRVPAGQLIQPQALALGPDGTLYAVDSTRHRVVAVGPDGTITPLAGGPELGYVDGPGPAARFTLPAALACQGDQLFVNMATARRGYFRPMSTPRTVVAVPILPLAGQDPLRLTSDAEGQTLVLTLDAAADVPPDSWGPALLRRPTALPHCYRVTAIAGPGAVPEVHELGAFDERFTDVQRLPGSRWLLARSRAAGPDDPNALILAPDGTVERRFHIGDAIAELQADADGRLWAGYFDEGVFGGPPGDAGLVGFDPAGRVTFSYNEQPDAMPIDSCYALNVTGPDEAWCYYYSAFRLVRVQGGVIAAHWDALPVLGFSAFATDGRRLLVAGTYGEEGRCFQVDLEAGTAEPLDLIDPDGNPLSPGLAHGRGRRLCFRDRGWWWRLELA